MVKCLNLIFPFEEEHWQPILNTFIFMYKGEYNELWRVGARET